DRPLPVRRQALIALASLDVDAAAKAAAGVLADHAAADDTSEIFRAFLQRKNGAATLAATLATNKLPADGAKVGVRAGRTQAREAPALIDALNKAGSLTAGKRTLTPAELQQMVADVAKHGDPTRGEQVFRRADMICLKCHAIAGAGGQVGPDLTSIGA